MKTYKILPILFLLFSVFCVSLFAQDNIKVFLNSEELENVQAKMVDGHIMLPAIETFEALGIKRTVLDNQCLTLAYPSSYIINFVANNTYINIEYNIDALTKIKYLIKLYVAPKIIDDIFLIPFEVVVLLGDVTGHNVEWNGEDKRIILMRNDKKLYSGSI